MGNFSLDGGSTKSDSFAHSASVLTKAGSSAAPAPRVGALSTGYALTKRSGHRAVVDVRAGRRTMVLSVARARVVIFWGARYLGNGFELCE
eukprot:2650592-Prymnesium_polylepis.1